MMRLLDAPSHPDPYAYYAELRQQGGVQYLDPPGLWVACDAASVAEAFAEPACHVRPSNEPVPAAIAGGPAGQLFGYLMRMNEGEAHQGPRRCLAPILEALNDNEVAELARRRLASIAMPSPAWLMFRFPVMLVATLVGFPAERHDWLGERISRYAACLNPLSNTQQRLAGQQAAAELLAMASHGEGCPAMAHASLPLAANLIGLLVQTHDATAGLMGNTLLTLQQPSLREAMAHQPDSITGLVHEVERYDPPIHNTRRFAAAPCRLGGARLVPGDRVLLLMAAANRDPALVADAETFRLDRQRRTSFTFGAGRHRCPGQRLARTLTAAAIMAVLQRPGYLDALRHHGYWPSQNARIPRLSLCHQETST